MLIPINRGYKRKYAVGGAGIFSKLGDFLSRFITKKQVVDTALNLAKSAASSAGNKLAEKITTKLLPKSQEVLAKYSAPTKLTPKSQEVLKKYSPSQNLNSLIDGSSIRFEDFVRGPGSLGVDYFDRGPGLHRIENLVRRLNSRR